MTSQLVIFRMLFFVFPPGPKSVFSPSKETTVHSQYLGSKQPLGGIYHYINIGSFFFMLLDKYGIKLLHVMYFSINMSGVEDNVENYQTYLMSCSTVIVFKSYGILFFVLSLISRSLL